MGLKRWANRMWYVWSWRARYWWHDTQGGVYAHWFVFGASLLVALIQLGRTVHAAAVPPPPGAPVKAIYWWVVQLIIMIVAAAVSYANRPKTQAPAPQSAEAPSTEDGQSAKHYLGTCWVDDQFILAWKQMGTEKVKSKGGKK